MNRGKLAAPSYLAAVGEACDEPVGQNSLVSLPDTDRLTECFKQGYQAAVRQPGSSYRRFFSKQEEKTVFRIAAAISEHLPTELAYLITKVSVDCGAIRVPMASLLLHAASIIRLDGDSLSALSQDETEGLLIDHNVDEEIEAYEMTIWGDRWRKIAAGCGSK